MDKVILDTLIKQVKEGIITLEQVPEKYRAEVEKATQ